MENSANSKKNANNNNIAKNFVWQIWKKKTTSSEYFLTIILIIATLNP